MQQLIILHVDMFVDELGQLFPIDIQDYTDNWSDLCEAEIQPDNPTTHLTFVKGCKNRGFKRNAYHVHIRYLGDGDEI
jgi:hypothetical protein